MSTPSIHDLKAAYRIPAAWRDLGFDGQPGKTCRCPFGDRPDRNPSFSIFDDGQRWRDFATGEAGDVLDFICRARGCDTVAAIRFIEERLGIVREVAPRSTEPSKWPELRCGSAGELARLNALRGFSVEALREAEERGFLHFGAHWKCGFWGVTDQRRRLIELRRITGEPWRGFGRLAERKAHCVGTGKAWPIGIAESEPFPKIAFAEGAPDFLALIHFAQIEGRAGSVAPLAMLGAGAGRIAAEALACFRGKHVRLFPHLDEAGCKAARTWARQIADAGAAKVDAFDFTGLVRDNGTGGKDLADVCRIAPECFEAYRKFWEMLP